MLRRNEKPKRKIRKVYQSTQQNIPIKDIINGIVITKDNTYVKIIEVKPTPFFLKSNRDRNTIYGNFCRMLKTGPYDIQFKIVNLPVDISEQLEVLEKEMKSEKIEQCLKIDTEYRKKLIESQRSGVTRRFFIIISSKLQRGFGRRPDPRDTIANLENIASGIAADLKSCENEVINPSSMYEHSNEYVAKIFYILMNRNKMQEETFETHLNEVYEKYFEEYQAKEFYVPPNDYIAPKQISFVDQKYVNIDGMYYRYAYIPSYGYDLSASGLYAGWLTMFTNTFTGVDVDVFLKKMDKDEVIGSIRRNLNYSIVESAESSQTTEAFDNSNKTLVAANYLKNGLSGNEDFYYMSTLITVCDSNPENLDFKMHELIKTAKANNFALKDIVFETENAYKSVLPLCNLDKELFNKTKRNVLTSGAGTIYPFTAYEINDPDGVYFGVDRSTGSLVIVDIFDKTKSVVNSNVFIAGATGSGKTYALSLMALRMRIKHIPVYIIAPVKQDEFRRVCEAVGGQFVELGPGSPSRINIMEILAKNAEAEALAEQSGGAVDNRSQLAIKADAVKRFVQLIVGQIDKEQEGLLSTAIYETYYRFGISEDNDSLWADKSKNIYKTMPILSDLCETMNSMIEKNGSVKVLYNILKSFVKTNGSSFDGQTNVNLNSDFVVFGLENLNDDDLNPGIFLTMDFNWVRIKQDATKRKALFCDEWWRLAKNEVSAKYSEEISRLIRAYNGAFVIATQRMSDINSPEIGDIGQTVVDQCDTRIVMKMRELDAKATQKMMMLTDSETEEIIKADRGDALFIYGKDKMRIRFVASSTEHDLITTDSKELTRINQEKQKKIAREKMKERIKNAENFDSIFFDSETFVLKEDTLLLNSEQYAPTLPWLDVTEFVDSDQYLA